MLKKQDDLTRNILSFLQANKAYKWTVPQITGNIFGAYFCDSNHKEYRRVLRRINQLMVSGEIGCKYVNRHIPARYFAW